jgi:hypothetical protein
VAMVFIYLSYNLGKMNGSHADRMCFVVEFSYFLYYYKYFHKIVFVNLEGVHPRCSPPGGYSARVKGRSMTENPKTLDT